MAHPASYCGTVSDTPQERGSRGNRGNGERRGSGRAAKSAAALAEAAERNPALRRIGIRELRQHASVYVDLAEKGYTVDVTNRGRLVAQLVPAKAPGSPLERLIAAGVLEPAEEQGGASDLDPYPAPPAGRPTAGDVIDSDRSVRPDGGGQEGGTREGGEAR
jgi:antitoxin (DNA-binding transcriptional repressor) of toxin-antitoxin stability system